MATIRSPRLDLVELTEDLLRLAVEGDSAALATELGVRVSPEWAGIVPARDNLKAVRQDPAVQPWLSRAVVLREARTLVGEVGFHHSPDELAVVEVGYEVLPGFRRRGLAAEAVRALTDWAFATGEASTVYATVAQENVASLALVRSLGFRFQEDYVDPADGRLLFFEAALPLRR